MTFFYYYCTKTNSLWEDKCHILMKTSFQCGWRERSERGNQCVYILTFLILLAMLNYYMRIITFLSLYFCRNPLFSWTFVSEIWNLPTLWRILTLREFQNIRGFKIIGIFLLSSRDISHIASEKSSVYTVVLNPSYTLELI